jgi:hypothetical protein
MELTILGKVQHTFLLYSFLFSPINSPSYAMYSYYFVPEDCVSVLPTKFAPYKASNTNVQVVIWIQLITELLNLTTF